MYTFASVESVESVEDSIGSFSKKYINNISIIKCESISWRSSPESTDRCSGRGLLPLLNLVIPQLIKSFSFLTLFNYVNI